MYMRAIDPNWVSYSLAIFICERCAGIHQSLGAHISKVKSIEDENWTEEQLQVSLSLSLTLAKTSSLLQSMNL